MEKMLKWENIELFEHLKEKKSYRKTFHSYGIVDMFYRNKTTCKNAEDQVIKILDTKMFEFSSYANRLQCTLLCIIIIIMV